MHTVRLRKLTSTLVLLPAIALFGCAGEPSIQTGEDAETVLGTLAKVDNSAVDLAYVDPNADYARYRKVHVEPLNLDSVEIIQPASSNSPVNRFGREWELTASDKETLQSAFRAAMEKELTAGGTFAVADAGGDDVLTVEGMLTRIEPSGPKDDQYSRSAVRSEVYTAGAGSMSVAVVIADGDSGEVLGIIKDTRSRTNSNLWTRNNRVTNMAEVRRNFSTWARLIHDGLLALQARAEAG